jgi:hypothetical protein
MDRPSWPAPPGLARAEPLLHNTDFRQALPSITKYLLLKNVGRNLSCIARIQQALPSILKCLEVEDVVTSPGHFLLAVLQSIWTGSLLHNMDASCDRSTIRPP